MKDINTEQECRLKNNVKEQAERIELLIFSTSVYLNVLTQKNVRRNVITTQPKGLLHINRLEIQFLLLFRSP